jgi:hypothetical protein
MTKEVQVGGIVEVETNNECQSSSLLSPLTLDDSTTASSFASSGGTSNTSASTSSRSLTLKEKPTTKMRLTSNQASAVRKQAALEKELSNHHFVQACKMYRQELHIEAQAIQNGQKPPNTTHSLQVMDLLFGLFKTTFFTNLEALWQERLSDPEAKDTITRNDIGLLCFGGKAGSEDVSPEFDNAIKIDFAQAKIANC